MRSSSNWFVLLLVIGGLMVADSTPVSAQFGRGDRGGDEGGDRGGRGDRGDRGDRGGDRGDSGRSRFGGGGPPGGFGGGPPGGFGGGPPGGGFDPSSFLDRLDRNGNGMIDADEQEGPARFMIQRMQQSDSSIQTGKPIPLSKIKEAFEEMRRGGRGGGDDRGGRGGDDDEEDSMSAGELVPGFGGVEMPLPVPGFGASAELMAVRVTEADTRQAQETFNRYDRNKNGFIDQDEISSRWSGNPLDYDQNRDGRLSVSELSVRYARRRADEETRRESRDDRRRGSDRGRESEPDLEVKDRYEGKVSFKRAEPRLPDGLPGWFAEKDQNNDGQVRMSEYASEWNDELVGEFYSFDRNFDGVITPDETLVTIEKGPVGSSSNASAGATAAKSSAPIGDISMDNIDAKYLSYAERILSRNDKDKDGELVASEWKEMLLDISDADLDRNGRITVNEYAAWQQYKATKGSGK